MLPNPPLSLFALGTIGLWEGRRSHLVIFLSSLNTTGKISGQPSLALSFGSFLPGRYVGALQAVSDTQTTWEVDYCCVIHYHCTKQLRQATSLLTCLKHKH